MQSSEETLNSASYRGARKQGAVMSASHDDSYAKPVTAMSIADINSANKNLWGNVGPAETQAAAPELAGTRVSRNVPVYTGAGIGDEVQPTQSDPPDGRSDNLLGATAVAGERDAEAPKKPKWSPTEVIRQQQAAIKKNPNEAQRIKEGKWRGEFAGDDLAEGTESMPPEGQADAKKPGPGERGHHPKPDYEGPVGKPAPGDPKPHENPGR